ncbi:MAG: hypothetical protein F4Y44_06205 [Chloroflexi bacterium]|nr:hypothetical protein [Chloroflexota bacterium]
MDPQLSMYMERTLDVLVVAGAEAVEMEIEELDEDEAALEARIRSSLSYRLEVDMMVSWLEGTPIRRAYSFHFMDSADVTIFRYDNARHHQGLEHFPHHKHIGASECVIGLPAADNSADTR